MNSRNAEKTGSWIGPF